MASSQQTISDWTNTETPTQPATIPSDPTRYPKTPKVTGESGGCNPSAGTVFFELVDGEYVDRRVEYVVRKVNDEHGYFGVRFRRGDHYVTVRSTKIREALADPECGKWVEAMYAGESDDGEALWIPHPRHRHRDDAEYDASFRLGPSSPKDLSFERMSGSGSQKTVNKFLDGREDGLVYHHLGGISSWKTGFVARYNGDIVSAITLHHYHPSTNGVEIAITRLANHEVAPKNTSTWMIGRARKWAERAGYERIASYADLDLNEGTVYHAAGFDPVGEPEQTTGKDWSGDDTVWTRQKYVAELSPEKYSEKSESWATETVEKQASTS